MNNPRTTSSLRADIDSGRTRDKVDFVDPAAAPLGTDAEAGGNVPQPEQLAAEANAIAPPKQGWRRDQVGIVIYSLVGGAVSVALLGIIALSA